MNDLQAAGWYARLLRLAPRRLRQRHGDEMTEQFLSQRAAAAGRGRAAGAALWLRAITDLLSAAIRFRSERGTPMPSIIEPLWQDVRLAIRSLARARGFTAVVLATLALSIGATSSIFAVVNAVVFRPLPYPDSDRLVEIAQQRAGDPRRLSVSPPNYFDLVAGAHAFQGLVAYGSGTVTMLSSGAAPAHLRGTFVTASFGDVIEVRPEFGRLFTDADDQPGAARVVVLSHHMWQQRFGGEPSIASREVTIDDAPATIVGVMPEGFSFPADATDVWMPMRLSRTTPANPAIPVEKYRNYRVLSVVARLRAGVPLSQAQAELSAIGATLAQQYPGPNRGMTLTSASMKEAAVGGIRRSMVLFLSAVLCLLLVACANIATMLAVRAAGRHRDVTLRLALGSGRMRIVRQLVVESLVLALAGGVAGLAAASGLIKLLIAYAPPGVPRLATAQLDATVILVTLGLSAICGLLFSLAPVWYTARRDLSASLKTGARTSDAPTHQRVRRTLIVLEVALSMMLLTTAGLLAQTTRALGNVSRGFVLDDVYRVDRLELPQRTPAAASADFYARVQSAVAGSAGMTSVGATLAVPLDPQGRFFVDNTKFAIDGRVTLSGADTPEARIQVASGGFFQALKVPLVTGRLFDDHDGPTSLPVVMINRALADRYFPDGDAVGHWLTHELSIMPGQSSHRQIVGVVDNVRQFNLDDPFEPQLFVPHTQMPWPAMALIIRSPLGATRVQAAVQSAVWAIDPKLPVPAAVPLSEALSDALGQPRFRALLLAAFAATALVLAAIGLYGVITFDVEQRRQEIAIHLMLGASPRHARSVIMGRGLWLAGLGTTAGLIVSYWVGRSLSSLIFGVKASDPLTIVAVTVLLAIVSGLSCYLATRRISSIDPIRTMTSN